jgi:serine/threonine protein kinase
MLKSGQVVAGRYQLASPIGEGAMGAVWRAEDQTLRRQVAIKFLFVKAARDPQVMVDQFLREARIAASVQHRNVIQTVDFGTFGDYQPFMVMELLNGESLGDRLAREPPLSREQVIHIVSLTLRGLSAVHDTGIVHRDLKPHNVFLQRDADAVYPKILDFGISRSVQQGARPSAIATQEGMIVGTPDYMSPEQARGEADIDKRSDIYSMGVMLYEALTGQLPFSSETVGGLIVQIMTCEPPPMIEVANDVSQALSDLVAQAMSKDRDQRFPDARAMRRALLGAAESGHTPGRRAISVPPPESANHDTPVPPRPAPTALEHGGTWGDFEGLNSPRIVDDSPPIPSLAPAFVPPKQQRMVARLGDALDDGAEAPDAAPPRAEPRASVAGAPPRERAGTRRAATAAPDDALNPLYSGVDQAAPDIDYVRAGVSPNRPVPQRRADPPRGAARRERPNIAPAARSWRIRGLAGWLLPIAALLLAGYVLMKPPSRTSRPVPGAAPTGALIDAPGRVPEGLARSLSTGLEQLHLQVRGRRANPGKAPPHLRDVVF